MWYYLPLSHSETIANQELALSKFAEMCWDTRQSEWSVYSDFLKMGLESAWKHYEIIAKYGRYPHRNAVLGRKSTEEEVKYLQDGGETFGG